MLGTDASAAGMPFQEISRFDALRNGCSKPAAALPPWPPAAGPESPCRRRKMSGVRASIAAAMRRAARF
jgi:hypothetical protein